MDFNKIKELAQSYEKDMTKFLRDLVKIPGESCGEKGHIDRIAEEMRKVGFDKVEIDPMGNVLGYMGSGKTLIVTRASKPIRKSAAAEPPISWAVSSPACTEPRS